jgi:hypothetical protein
VKSADSDTDPIVLNVVEKDSTELLDVVAGLATPGYVVAVKNGLGVATPGVCAGIVLFGNGVPALFPLP